MYFVVDIEATCWEKRKVRDKNEIIEIGIVLCNIKGDVIDTYQSFVKPKYNASISSFCKKLTNIKQEWIDDAHSLDIVISNISKWAKITYDIELHNIAWCSFGDWDDSCLSRDCDRHRIPYPFGEFINLKDLYADYSGYDQCGLKDALIREGLTWEGEAHRALDDANNARKLAKFLVTPDIFT